MEYKKGDFNWSTIYNYRKEIRKFYPSVYKLKIKKKLLDIIVEEIHDGATLLDVGASSHKLKENIQRIKPEVNYKTMDIDRSQDHDYYDLNSITESFDLIILSEVIEHIEFKEGISLLRKLLKLLKSRGKIIITTPNIHHPNRYWWDADHRTPYRYDVIGASVLSAGFSVDKIVRIYNDQFIMRACHMYFASCIHKFFDIDFAKSIAVVAHKT